MYIDKRGYLLLALAAGVSAGVIIASQLLRRRQREIAFRHEHACDLKTWENEGGNEAPDAARSVQS